MTGLKPEQYAIMAAIADEPLYKKAIADQIGVAPSTVVNHLDTLLDHDLVEQQPEMVEIYDGTRLLETYTLTDKGRSKLTEHQGDP